MHGLKVRFLPRSPLSTKSLHALLKRCAVRVALVDIRQGSNVARFVLNGIPQFAFVRIRATIHFDNGRAVIHPMRETFLFGQIRPFDFSVRQLTVEGLRVDLAVELVKIYPANVLPLLGVDHASKDDGQTKQRD